MTQARGSNAEFIGGIKETTFGTTPGTPAGVVLPIISSSLSATQAQSSSNVLRGRRDAVKPSRGNYDVSGSVVAPVDLAGVGYWIQKLMGDASTTGVGPYTHVFTVGDTLDSWVMEHGFSDITQYELFNGCKVNSLAFSFNAGSGDELTVSAEVVGAKSTLGTSSVDSSPTENTLSRLAIGDLALKEGGSSIANVTALDFTITNNLDTGIYCVGGSGYRADLPEGICNVSGNLTAMFENTTLLTKAKNGTETSLQATLTSGSYSLDFEIAELQYGATSAQIEGPQGILVQLPFNAYYDDDSGDSIITATLINTIETYA